MSRYTDFAKEETVRSEIAEEVMEVDKTWYLTEDEYVKKLIYEKYRELLPLYSRIMSLTYLSRNEAEALKMRIDYVVGLAMLKYCTDGGTVIELEAIRIFLRTKVNDAMEGRKLKHLTQTVKIMQFQEERPRRWRLWFK